MLPLTLSYDLENGPQNNTQFTPTANTSMTFKVGQGNSKLIKNYNVQWSQSCTVFKDSYYCFSTHTHKKNNGNVSAAGTPTAKTGDEHASSHDMTQVRNNQYGSHLDETLEENKADAPCSPPLPTKNHSQKQTNPSSSMCWGFEKYDCTVSIWIKK